MTPKYTLNATLANAWYIFNLRDTNHSISLTNISNYTRLCVEESTNSSLINDLIG